MKKICYFFSENIRLENHFLIIFVNRNNFFSSFVFLPSCNSLCKKVLFYWDPKSTPDTFHELKLVPSDAPCGIFTCIVCWPAFKSPSGMKFGLVTVPGHQLDLLRSDDERPSGKFPEAGL